MEEKILEKVAIEESKKKKENVSQRAMEYFLSGVIRSLIACRKVD